MNKRKLISRLLISSLSVLIIVGSALTLYFLMNPDTKRDDTTKITLVGCDESGKTSSRIEFEAPKLNPGDTVAHTVELTGEVEGAADVTLNFDANKSFENKLAEYLYVTVKINGEEYCSMKLAELFDAKLDPVECIIDEKEPVMIDVSYYMPLEIGNEAAHTEAFFDLVIISTNE